LLRRPDGCKLKQKLFDIEVCPDEKPHCLDGDAFV
jgi:hypothetical protein